jgi:hypothetical protein
VVDDGGGGGGGGGGVSRKFLTTTHSAHTHPSPVNRKSGHFFFIIVILCIPFDSRGKGDVCAGVLGDVGCVIKSAFCLFLVFADCKRCEKKQREH